MRTYHILDVGGVHDKPLLDYEPGAVGHYGIFDQPACRHIWEQRYKKEGDASWLETCSRVVAGVFLGGGNAGEKVPSEYISYVVQAMRKGLWMPAGRILAGAGTDDNVTLMNCYVSGVIEDSLDGIMEALRQSAKTMSMGGGVGYDFSPIRPQGAVIGTLESGLGAAGVVPFMRVYDQTCRALESYGNRRGAQMGILRCDHPDIFRFINSKQVAGELTNFNISVAVTDKFIEAVKDDQGWNLKHSVPPRDWQTAKSVTVHSRHGMHEEYVYETVRARDLWDAIMASTYKYSEPGVFFIDRVNMRNPLSGVETICATNPCGEQPLPPYGTCNLGSINLARLVEFPKYQTHPTPVSYTHLTLPTICSV